MLSLLVPLLCVAAAPDGDRTAEVEQGRVLIRDLREEEALKVLEPLTHDATLSAPLRATACIYAGIAQMNLGQDNAARALFALALEIEPGSAVPAWVSRKVRAVFDDVLEKQRKLKEVLQPAPAPAPQPERRASGVTVGLAAGAAVSAAAAIGLFIAWGAVHQQAATQPDARLAETLDARSKGLWYAGETCGALAVGLAAGAVLSYSLAPTPSGGAVVMVSGRF